MDRELFNTEGDIDIKHFVDNGYGLSIIRNGFSYGGSHGLFEVAILEGNEEAYELTYNTIITSDVLGHLSIEEVFAILKMLETLLLKQFSKKEMIN